MYKNIMVPVDLAHVDQLEKALSTAADLAKHYDASLHVVGVTGIAPRSEAHNPEEYAEKLEAFAKTQTDNRGVKIIAKPMVSVDVAIEIDDKLEAAAKDINADLIIMASHVPGFMEHVFASRAGYLASHSDLSVFIVR